MKRINEIERRINELDSSFNGKIESIKDEIKKLKESERPERPDFIITISDSYCTYKYPLNIGRKFSIAMITERIYKAFGIPEENGILIDKD